MTTTPVIIPTIIANQLKIRKSKLNTKITIEHSISEITLKPGELLTVWLDILF